MFGDAIWNQPSVGVFGGVITAIVIYFFNALYKRHLIPFLSKTIYRGINLTGKWKIAHTQIDNGAFDVASETTIELTQKGHVITGSASISYSEKRNQLAREYKISKGSTIRDRFVIIILTIMDKKSIGYQIFLLEVRASGELMEGHRSFYGYEEKRIRGVGCKIERMKE